MIWSKAFVMERERYDGADIIHLVRCCSSTLDWARLLERFGAYWEVLLSHLILFGFVYPSDRSCIPNWIVQELLRRLEHVTSNAPADRLCRGTLLSRAQYLVDIEQSGYEDARLAPKGQMTSDEIARWTTAIEGPVNNCPQRQETTRLRTKTATVCRETIDSSEHLNVSLDSSSVRR